MSNPITIPSKPYCVAFARHRQNVNDCMHMFSVMTDGNPLAYVEYYGRLAARYTPELIEQLVAPSGRCLYRRRKP